MFNKGFYPTSKATANQMIEMLGGRTALRNKTILEPQAGKGDLIKPILELFPRSYERPSIYCLEIEPELQSILRSIDGCKLIGSDFLSEKIHYKVDIIIMNPPFANGDKHLLKAWEILKNGEIVCLLNAETYNNPYSQTRKQLKQIIDQHGEVVDLGECFSDSERRTDVNTIAVHLKKQTEETILDFDFEDSDVEIPKDPEQAKDLELRDPFENRQNRFNAALEYAKKAIEFAQKFKDAVKPISKIYYHSEDFAKAIYSNNFNELFEELNANCWQTLLDEINVMQSYMTSSVRDQFMSNFQHQKSMAYNKANMIQLYDILFNNRESILDQCIVEVFDNMTKYYPENREHVPEWKTNDHYKVNRKVILPYYVEYGKHQSPYDKKQYGSTFYISYDMEQKLVDIDRALCHLTKIKVDSKDFVTISSALKKRFDEIGRVKTGEYFDKQVESTYFKIKFHKSGTIHLNFKDKTLWQWFNMKAAELKGHPLPEAQTKDLNKKIIRYANR